MREHIGKANTSRRLEGFIPKPKSADLLRERRAIADCLQERGLCCPQQYSDVVRSGHAWRLLFDRKLLRTGKSTGKTALRGWGLGRFLKVVWGKSQQAILVSK